MNLKKITINYTAKGHHNERERLSIEVSFASDIARNILKHQAESLFVKGKSRINPFQTWLDYLAMLQGFSRAEFESAEEVK